MGEMKMAKSLYLKGFATPDGRDGAFSDNNCSLFINNARLIFNNAARIRLPRHSLPFTSALSPCLHGTLPFQLPANVGRNR